MSSVAGNRVEVLHGVNLDQLGKRDPKHYGALTMAELEIKIGQWGRELGLEVIFFQTNHEGEYVERLHRLREYADAAILNPGSWTHYSYAIHDALELAAVPAVEIHISDIKRRESWRKHSVISDLALATISGKGADGYREGLEILAKQLETIR